MNLYWSTSVVLTTILFASIPPSSCLTIPTAKNHTISACFNASRTLTMPCGAGLMVKVDRILHGYSPHSCGYSIGDCVVEVTDVSIACVGRESCQLNLPSGSEGKEIHRCGHHTTYIQVHYQCIPETSVVDICSGVELTQQRGFVATPRYPNNYDNSRDCTVNLRMPYDNQVIRLYAVDLRLESNASACGDWLHAFDGFGSFTTCSPQYRKHLLTSSEKSLRITFHSNHAVTEKGFWLYYEAWPLLPDIPTTTTTDVPTTSTASLEFQLPTVTSDTTQRNISNVIIAVMPSTTNPVTQKQQVKIIYGVDPNTFPIGLMVGVVLGVVLCILVVLLIVLVLKRRKENKMRNSSSCSSSAGFLGCKSNLHKASDQHSPDGATNTDSATWPQGQQEKCPPSLYDKQDSVDIPKNHCHLYKSGHLGKDVADVDLEKKYIQAQCHSFDLQPEIHHMQRDHMVDVDLNAQCTCHKEANLDLGHRPSVVCIPEDHNMLRLDKGKDMPKKKTFSNSNYDPGKELYC